MSSLLCGLSHGSSSLNRLYSGCCSTKGRIATRQLKSGLPALSVIADLGKTLLASW